MRRLMRRLEYLCIEIMSKNIQRFKRIPRNKWKLMQCHELGDRLLLACLSNSFEKMDEDAYQFILGNFSIKKFMIFPKIYEKVKYFDFLNGKSFDELKIILITKIKLRNIENFSIKTKRLYISKQRNTRLSTSENDEFFSKIIVEEDIKISANEDSIILSILENSSANLQGFEIDSRFSTEYFKRRLVAKLKEKRHLTNVNLDFLSGLDKGRIFFLFETSFSNLNSFTFRKSTREDWTLKTVNQCLKWIKSIKTLNVSLPVLNAKTITETEEITEFLSILKSMETNNLISIEFHLFGYKNSGRELSEFLQTCYNLEKFVLFEHKPIEIDFSTALSNSSKTLKSFTFRSINFEIKEKIKSLTKFFFHSYNIREISLERINFNGEFFSELLKSIENLKLNLITLTIKNCQISDREFQYLPKSLEKLNKLESFSLSQSFIDGRMFSKILKSLHYSSETLGVIILDKDNESQLDNTEELMKLLYKCEKLKTIKLKTFINHKEIPKLLNLLKKFRNTLENIDLSICFSPDYLQQLFDFLSGCTKLQIITGEFVDKIPDWNSFSTCLENSKYTLKKIPEYQYNNYDFVQKFPFLLFFFSSLLQGRKTYF